MTSTDPTPFRCPTCEQLREEYGSNIDPADGETPHAHCPNCDGAVLPGMASCAWCDSPVSEVIA